MPYNYGFDDERGDYKVVMQDQIAYRYEPIEFLGKGSFGQAVKCYDYKTNSYVAVKIIRNKKRFHHQAGVELKILQYLKENDPDDVNNIIRMKEYVVFRKHLMLTFELLSINLELALAPAPAPERMAGRPSSVPLRDMSGGRAGAFALYEFIKNNNF